MLVHAFVVGLLLRAKIYNDLKILKHLETGLFALIGAEIPKGGRMRTLPSPRTNPVSMN